MIHSPRSHAGPLLVLCLAALGSLALFTDARTWQPWWLLGGSVAGALLGAFVGLTLGGAARVQRLVAERTAELIDANERLTSKVAERHEAQAALAAQRALFQRIIDASPTLTFIKDRDGVFLLANQTMATIYGLTTERMTGMNHLDIGRQLGASEEEVRRFLKADQDVIDDHATNRVTLEAQLRAWGMEADGVADGLAALARMRRADADGQPYSLAILDYHMPDMDGLELARTIKLDPVLAPMRLVMLTSVSQRRRGTAPPQAGIAAFLAKPVRQSSLYNCLMTIMGAAEAPLVSPINRHQDAVQILIQARVLVVEDNVVNQRLAMRLLEKLGCRVDVAGNGYEAISVLARLAYDVVFMDCQMPEMDGLDATVAIREREAATGQHVPIIAMTANAMPGDRERCLAAGMDDYVSKPVKRDDLVGMLQKWAASGADALSQRAVRAASERPMRPVVQRPPLDPAVFAELRALGGDEDPMFLPNVVEEFVQHAAAHIAALHVAACAGDAVALGRAAHTLKSTSANVGALRMSALCSELQRRGRTGSVAEAAEHIDQLVREFERVQQALAQACPQLRGTAII